MFFGNWESFSKVAPRGEGLDYALFTSLNSALDGRFANLLKWLDDPIPIAVTAIALVLAGFSVLRGRSDALRRSGGALLVGYLAQAAVVNFLKSAVARPRPHCDPEIAANFPSIEPLIDHRSFPSGHVASSAAIALGIWLMMGRGRLRHLLFVYPIVMALSRILLRVHWPTDTLAGIAVGITVTGGIYWLFGLKCARDALASSAPVRASLAVVTVMSVLGLIGVDGAARDPVSGEIAPFISTAPSVLRFLFEPWLGVAQALSANPVTTSSGIFWVAVGFFGYDVIRRWRRGSPRVRRALLIYSISGFLVVGLSYSGWVPNDRVTSTRTGAFVDFHLHGADPCDGGRSMDLIRWRQGHRGVGWATWSWHDAIAPEPFDVSSPTDLVATEWSGGDHPKTIAPHVLLIGPRTAVEAGIAEKDALSAVRVSKALGAYCIVAHAWRTSSKVPFPTVAEWKAAGVDGFEVGNRSLDRMRSLRQRLADLDSEVQKAGLARWSFSDDHGIPAASPCLTWVDGLPAQPPRDAADAIRLLRAVPVEGIRPLVLGTNTLGYDDTSFFRRFDFPPFYFATAFTSAKDTVVLFWDYLIRMRPPSRLAWAIWTLIAVWWISRAKPRLSGSPSDSPVHPRK